MGRASEPGHDDGRTLSCDDALAIAGNVAGELAAAGAAAVALMGSFARGDQGPHSDLDILALGAGPAYELHVREGLLVALSWSTVEEVEASFLRPERAGYAVQGWRDARIVRDEQGVASDLQQRALEWSWDELGRATCDRYVAGEICGYAEEVHKLANMLVGGNLSGAAVQRNLLATRLAVILAVHLRLLYGTENALWTLVADSMGDTWTAAQARAFGLSGEAFAATCAAALELYALSAERVWPLFDARERAVVTRALDISARFRESTAR